MKGRKTRSTGGVNSAAEDLATRNMEYTKDSNVNRAAVQRKAGGMVDGKMAKMHAGRKPRKSGGRLKLADWSAAQKGTPAKGRKTDGSLDA